MLTRRHFIRNSAMALPLMSLSGFLLSSCRKLAEEPNRKTPKIGIIGGGIAGLHAAKILFERYHYDVEILEAGDRIGGRIQSLDKAFGKYNVELGAAAVYGNDNIWYSMLQSSNPHEITDETPSTYYINGVSTTNSELKTDQEYLYMEERLNEMTSFTGSPEVSVSDYIEMNNIPEKVKYIFRDISEEMFGTSVNRASVVLNSTENADKIRNPKFIPGAESFYKVLVREYANILPFSRINTAVEEIDYSGTTVKVRDRNQQIREYDKVLVCVPLSILKLKSSHQNGIRFSPELPESKKKALSSMSMDSGVRIVLKLNKKFWDHDAKTVYTGGSIGKFEVVHEDLLSNQFIISATVSGEQAENCFDQKNETEIIDMIKEEWAKNISNTAANSIVDHTIKLWSKDPFIRGTFSYHKTGSGEDSRRELSRSVDDKIFFAGEACNCSNKSGTINGAMDTAIVSATEIAALFA